MLVTQNEDAIETILTEDDYVVTNIDDDSLVYSILKPSVSRL